MNVVFCFSLYTFCPVSFFEDFCFVSVSAVVDFTLGLGLVRQNQSNFALFFFHVFVAILFLLFSFPFSFPRKLNKTTKQVIKHTCVELNTQLYFCSFFLYQTFVNAVLLLHDSNILY